MCQNPAWSRPTLLHSFFFDATLSVMFLRSYKRKKNGKLHEYFSVVENRRLSGDKTVQRTVLYLGEITSSQENTWRKTLEVFDEDSGQSHQKMLFTDSAVITESQLDSIQVKLSQMKLCRPRSFGNCYSGLPSVETARSG
jgi:hypothetical protein